MQYGEGVNTNYLSKTYLAHLINLFGNFLWLSQSAPASDILLAGLSRK